MRGGNHMDNQLPELKVNMLGRFSITYGAVSYTHLISSHISFFVFVNFIALLMAISVWQ